jgi:acetyltransferase
MSTYHLSTLLAPKSLALVGASPRANSLGRAVLANLRRAGFAGRLYPVNPKHREIDGLACYPDLAALPEVPDVVVIACPARAVPGVVAAAGTAGVAAAIVMTAGLGHGRGSAQDGIRREARKYGLRLVGPNCIGVIAPRSRLDASFTASPVMPGDLALISQSGAVVAGLIEWAAEHRIGFSGIVSLGDQSDVDFGDCLDLFAADPETRAIILYVESVVDARKFMSAARAAAMVKPVVVV